MKKNYLKWNIGLFKYKKKNLELVIIDFLNNELPYHKSVPYNYKKFKKEYFSTNNNNNLNNSNNKSNNNSDNNLNKNDNSNYNENNKLINLNPPVLEPIQSNLLERSILKKNTELFSKTIAGEISPLLQKNVVYCIEYNEKPRSFFIGYTTQTFLERIKKYKQIKKFKIKISFKKF